MQVGLKAFTLSKTKLTLLTQISIPYSARYACLLKRVNLSVAKAEKRNPCLPLKSVDVRNIKFKAISIFLSAENSSLHELCFTLQAIYL